MCKPFQTLYESNSVIMLFVVYVFVTDPQEQLIDDVTVEEFASLLNFNLVSYFTFSKVMH